MKQNIFTSISCFICISMLYGCSAIKTITDTSPEGMFGIPYYLPKNLVELKVTRTVKGQDLSYAIEVKPILIPDTENRFVLQRQPNPLASDRLCVARSNTGLLQSVQFATDDKTDEILVKLAELAAKVAKTAATGPAGLRGRAVDLPEGSITATAIGDPEKPEMLRQQIIAVLPEVTSLEFPGIMPYSKDRKCPPEAICFSTLTSTPVLINIERNGLKLNAATTVSLVNFSQVGKLKIDRPFLVENITKLGFDNGVLTSMAFKQPSEGLALVSLPLDILDAVMAVPANFFSTALGGTFSDQKSILEQQKTLAGSQNDIRKSEKENRTASSISETAESFQLECQSLKSTK
ncbi:MAG: hypothetical protein Q8L15_20955 [Methylobacter sp.]|nr:hypothetical protein [Methylobacter sp.]